MTATDRAIDAVEDALASARRGNDPERVVRLEMKRDALQAKQFRKLQERLKKTAKKEPRAHGKLVAGDDGLRTREEGHARPAQPSVGGNDRSAAPGGQRVSAEGGPPTPAAPAKRKGAG